MSEAGLAEQQARLQRLWEAHRHTPFPGGRDDDPRLQEIALYESWLGSLVEAVLANRGQITPVHRLMLDVRRREGNQAIWAAAGELGEAARTYVARLLEIEEVLAELPAPA